MNMVYGYLFETRRKDELKIMFGQYVPEKHINEMLLSGDNFGLSGDDREMTVLFADIRGFTTLSESLSASQLKELLNAVFTPLTEIIFKNSGTIDKYVGDMIMAFWGAPLNDTEHASHALTAALDMQQAITQLHVEFSTRDWPTVNIGIGLNTGMMSVGDMGSQFRRSYTVLGDSVNLASRIEGLTKYYGVKIMVSEDTQHNQPDFVFRQLDRVRVKGKKKGITIFEVVCRQSEASIELQHDIELNQKAIDYYLNQSWEKSNELFTLLHHAHPEVKLYTLYLERLAEFQHTPPPHDWDGVFIHTSK
jgi:adenylate cyclase